MLSLSILFMAALLPLAFAAPDRPVFTLDCSPTGYPAACDTHCFAVVCSSTSGRGGNDFRAVAKYLHYAEKSATERPNPETKTSEADYRRNAIGCGSNDCPAGLSCDEFPYASTYDGGLGCLNSRYISAGGQKSDLATTGVTHCASLSDNTRHGVALASFYRLKKFGNGREFQIGFDEANIDNAPTCKRLRKYGKSICTELTNSNLFKVVTSPHSKSYCPDRPRTGLRRSMPERLTEADLADYESREVKWHSSVDTHGNKLLLPFADGPLEAGTPVFHGIGNGTTFHSVVM